MTDNEIIKALQCCRTSLIYDCKRCNLRLENGARQPFCTTTLIGNAFDLINRLQAENERLKEKGIVVLLKPENAQFENLERFETRQISKEMLPAIVRRVKTEAYKECIEKVKENSNKMELVCSGALVRTDYTITEDALDNLLKEMVGEDK